MRLSMVAVCAVVGAISGPAAAENDQDLLDRYGGGEEDAESEPPPEIDLPDWIERKWPEVEGPGAPVLPRPEHRSYPHMDIYRL